jgi:hypothetical protein
MLGNLSDEETNRLIGIVSENVRTNLMGRSVVETKLFPVSHYIHVATYILYDQAFQYKITKEITKIISPEELARRNKTLGSYLNQLAFNSFAMLYLHGRAQVISDNLQRKHHESIEVEPEEKKKELKFILDYWKRLSPNYRNDGKMVVEDGTIQIIPQSFVDKLRGEMMPVGDRPDLVKKVKRTTAMLTSRNFLAQAECRAGIFEHGPYETESPDEKLIFKEFQLLYAGDELENLQSQYNLNIATLDHIKTKAKSPVANVIFGMTLKNINKLEFNDWGTMFSDPPDFTKNITSVGLWTKELIHPRDPRYSDIDTIKTLSFDYLDPLMKYSQDAQTEMYLNIAKWDYLRKLMAGVNLYSNFIALYALFAGLEDKWDWNWINDVIENQQRSDLVNVTQVKWYIDHLAQFPKGVHPFLARFFRSKKARVEDPPYYFLQD